VLVIRFAPRGLLGAFADVRAYLMRRVRLRGPIGEAVRG
jgi:hypothetical protein